MPTRILSFSQLCLEADPGMAQGALRPWVYQFSNNRRFYEHQPVYGSAAIIDDTGIGIQDDSGNRITSDESGLARNKTGFPFGTGAFGQDGF